MPYAGPFSFTWANAANSIRGRGVKHGTTADQVDYTAAATDFCIGVTDSADIIQNAPIDIHTVRGLKLLVEMDGSGTSIAAGDKMASGANGIWVKAASTNLVSGISCGVSTAAATLRWMIFLGSVDEVLA